MMTALVLALLTQTQTDREFQADLQRQVGALRIPFAPGGDRLEAQGEQLLTPVLPLLLKAPSVIEVAGHADATGDAAQNRRLSQRRAESVRAWLVQHGVKPELLVARGYGADEPVASNATPAGRAQNRRIVLRVEAAGPSADATLTSVRPAVQARTAKRTEWLPAPRGLGLFPLDEVATLRHASAELTFRDQSTLQLRENAMAIVYGDESTTRRRQRGSVELVAGEAMLSLAELRATPLTVSTPAAQVAARSRAIVVDVDQTQMSRVSVHQGSAQVAAAGAAVKVPQGQGTRVAQGKRPEAPRPLPASPRWAHGEEAFRASRPEGAEARLELLPVAGATAYRIDLARDEGLGDLVDSQLSGEPAALVKGLAPGTYFARATSRDEAGLVSLPSALLRLTVGELAVPTVGRSPLRLAATPPPNMELVVDGAVVTPPVDLHAPGHHRVVLRSRDGAEQEAWDVAVRPTPPEVTTELAADGSRRWVAHFVEPIESETGLEVVGLEGTQVGPVGRRSATDFEAALSGARPARVETRWEGATLSTFVEPNPPPVDAGVAAAPALAPRVKSWLPARAPAMWSTPADQSAEHLELEVALAAMRLTDGSLPLRAAVTAEVPWGEGSVALRAVGVTSVAGTSEPSRLEGGVQVLRRLAGTTDAAALSWVGDAAMGQDRAGAVGAMRSFLVGGLGSGGWRVSTAQGLGLAMGQQVGVRYLGNLLGSVKASERLRITLQGDVAAALEGPAHVELGVGAGFQFRGELGELGLGVRAGLLPDGQAQWGQLGATASWSFVGL